MRMRHGSRRQRHQRSWGDAAPKPVPELSADAGQPSAPHDEGGVLSGYVEKPEEVIPPESLPETEPAAAAEEPSGEAV